MAVQAASTKLYADLIQPILDTYSGSFDSLDQKMREMDDCKRKTDIAVKDSLLSQLEEEKKKKLLRENLATYHTFLKTQEFVNELFETLKETHVKCSRVPISAEDYETITKLGADAEGLRKRELALGTVNDHVAHLIEKFSVGPVYFANKRVPEVAKSLHPLVKILDPESSSWEFIPWSSRTLEWHHEKWLEQATGNQKNWKPEIKTNMANSASFETQEASFKKLHEALFTLNLTYVDPTTNKGYGVNPNKSEGKISESLESGKEEDNSDTTETSGKETLSDSESEEMEENPTSSPLGIIAQNYDANSAGQTEEKKEMEEPLLNDSPAAEEPQESSSEKIAELPTSPESSLEKSEGKKEEIAADKKTSTPTLNFAQVVKKGGSGQNPKKPKGKRKAAAVNE